MQPINYLSNVRDTFESAIRGYQFGSAIQQDQQQQAAAQAQAEQAAAMQAELASASRDVSKIPGLMVRYPQLAEKLKVGRDAMTEEQQRGLLAHSSEVAAALASGRPDVAVSALKTRAQALRNSGDERGAKAAEDAATWAETDPDSLLSATAIGLTSLNGGDKVVKSIIDMATERRAAAKAPAELRTAEAGASKAEADAKTAGVTAQFAESNAVKDLEKKGWDIRALQEDIDIKKQANRIAAMNAQTARLNSDTQRQELGLKIREATQKLDSTIRDKAAAAESGAGAIDNMLNTIERIKLNPRLNDVVGGIEGRIPGVRDESVDAIALIETLGSQAFLAQIPNIKGMGALSNAEGEKLQSALQNLSRKQSETQFRANLDEASRLLKKGRETLAKSSGVPLGKPDTPAAPGARPPLDSFIR